MSDESCPPNETDSVSSYLQEIGRHPLLSHDQEIELALLARTAGLLKAILARFPNSSDGHVTGEQVAGDALDWNGGQLETATALCGVLGLNCPSGSPRDMAAALVGAGRHSSPLPSGFVSQLSHKVGKPESELFPLVADMLVRVGLADRAVKAPASNEAGSVNSLWRGIAREGKEAADTLTVSNLRLVVSVAKRYASPELPLLDAVQEGSLGLMTAIRKFDPFRGLRFGTYATWWIRQAIGRASWQSRTIRLPMHVAGKARKLAAAETEIRLNSSQEPTAHEAAAHLGWPVETVETIRRARAIPLSLELENIMEPGSDADAERPGSRHVPGVDSPTEFAVMQIAAGEELEEVLSPLPERHKHVLRLRFGVAQDHPWTLAEVARLLGVSRERVRQIESRALELVRKGSAPLAAGRM